MTLAEHMVAKGYTPRSLATAARIGLTTVYGLMLGRVGHPLTIESVCKVLRVEPHDVTWGKPSQYKAVRRGEA